MAQERAVPRRQVRRVHNRKVPRHKANARRVAARLVVACEWAAVV